MGSFHTKTETSRSGPENKTERIASKISSFDLTVYRNRQPEVKTAKFRISAKCNFRKFL
jgi:hypothetical protein